MFSIYIFTLIGMELFPFVKQNEDLGYNAYNNFSGFLPGLQSLYKVLTSENWDATVEALDHTLTPNDICFDYALNYKNYQIYGLNQCGNNRGFVFLYTFYVLNTYIL
jgi:hypothetical protein